VDHQEREPLAGRLEDGDIRIPSRNDLMVERHEEFLQGSPFCTASGKLEVFV